MPNFDKKFVGSSTGQSSHILIRCSTRRSTIRRPPTSRGRRNAPEVVREVGVHDFRMATKQQLFHLDGSLLGVAPSAVGIDFRWKVGFANNLAAFPASRVC